MGQNHDSLDLLMYGILEKTNTVLEKFSIATVMIKMRRVIEIKLGAAGGPAHSVKPCPGANRFLGFSAKTGDSFT